MVWLVEGVAFFGGVPADSKNSRRIETQKD